MKPNISIVLCGIKLQSPTILSAGILGLSADTMKRVADSGAGAVVTKSTGIECRPGHPAPNIVEVESGLLNAMGLPNPGIDAMCIEIRKLANNNVPVIASIYGFTPGEYALAAKRACSFGASAIELNVSCPNVGKIGCELGQNAKMVSRITKAVKNSINRPVLVKLTPNVTDIVEIGKSAQKAGADGITAINTLSGMVIDIDTRTPILGAKKGGLSGPAIKAVAIKSVFDLYKSLKIPIIGCGGIVSWKDAVEFLLAGATSIQVGTGVLYRNIAIFKQINEGIAKYMKRNGIRQARQLTGLAHVY